MTKTRLAPFAPTTLLVLLGLVAGSSAEAQSCPSAAALTGDITGALATVRYLADDALEGRLAGSPGERCAGDYIAARFKELGLRHASLSGTYFQDVPLASALNPHAPKGQGRNVIGFLEGSDPLLRTDMIIIGAHYDHLGRGDFGSTAPDQKNVIHNGADDNASGVAALLEVATRLSKVRLARSIVFMAFTGEESGLLGSQHFAANPSFPLTQVRAMINMDMVGRLGAGPLIVYGIGTAPEWTGIIDAATSAEGVQYKAIPDGTGPSDHTSFYMKDIPVLHFFTNVHGDYHKPSDDWDKIDAAGLDKVSAIVTRVAQQLSRPTTVVTLVRGAGRPPAPAGQSTSGYGAYLGTVPDFKPVDRGVLISGATPGSPADQAGLKAGDIIIKFDEEAIADLQGMTDALRKRKPGDAVRISVLREGKEVVLNAVLKTRS